MVQWQLCTLENLMYSGFGRPFPRHGLQLLFWFSNQCVTCDAVQLVVTMKLVSDCQPENGNFGFHLFGNMEELLPVLSRPRKSRSKVTYFEVGNLSTETYPASANLPAYVRENYRSSVRSNNSNIDRIIIGYRVRTRVVETVYVTEHDPAAFGRFRFDRTFEISCELIQALQNPQLDLTSFLIQMGYYVNVLQGIGEIPYSDPSAQQTCSVVQNYSGYTATTQQQQLYWYPSSYEQHVHYSYNTSAQSGPAANYRKLPTYNYWKLPREAFSGKPKKRDGGEDFGFLKLLLGAGALYLAAKCLFWLLGSWWSEDVDGDVELKPQWTLTFWRRAPSYRHTHVMLDYVF
ncbi:uncharacterized protein LOC116324726 [Oreochromis aureus]|uniref:SEA domain-containing protein n=1 Tax=Oreochromis aureus TaxID=47969 RepID=A0AAZ1XID7_OREAU|nr:uncharacterized protein LOC116324726 [Oreochromis aureus]XP_031601299.2 uncharacterized protein LOC116324726 [Oreochromis aureus]XP_039469691.1 uncharacterized protein LOC116324726 [Oreochromis aureus]